MEGRRAGEQWVGVSGWCAPARKVPSCSCGRAGSESCKLLKARDDIIEFVTYGALGYDGWSADRPNCARAAMGLPGFRNFRGRNG